MIEYVICGASLETVCSGEHPDDEELQALVNAAFEPDWQATHGYRILPRLQYRIIDEEETEVEDLRTDGTYREMPEPIRHEHGDIEIHGGIICTACYVTVCLLSPSGAGMTHEIRRAIDKARTMDPAELPAIR